MPNNQNRNYSQRGQSRSDRDYQNRSSAPDQFYDDQGGQFGEGGDYGNRSPDYRNQDYDRDFDQRGYGRSDPFYGDRDDNRSMDYRPGYDDDDAMSGRAYGQGRSGSRGYGSQVNTGSPRHDEDYSRGTGYRGDGYRDNSRFNRHDNDDRYGRGNRNNRDDRGFFDKAGDEISSWFGDDEAERRRMRDQRGRGPKNYQRSNERLLEDACEQLTHSSHVDARQINVTAKDNEITLDGTVSSRREKRAAEDAVHDISGVKHVQNNLRIEDRDYDDDRDRSSNRGYGDVADDKEVRKDDDATNKATSRKKS